MRIDSKSIDDLRADVAANVRVFITLMKQWGYSVGISSTLRNDEQQAYLYEQGRTRPGEIITYSKVTTFHGVGLAFDIFQNIPGKEWDDPEFWAAADALRTDMGFSMLGFEKSHAEWSAHGAYTGSQVRAGDLPPDMPPYGEAEMTGEEIYKKLDDYLRTQSVPDWAKDEFQQAIDAGITDGTSPTALIPRYQAAIMAKRALVGQSGK